MGVYTTTILFILRQLKILVHDTQRFLLFAVNFILLQNTYAMMMHAI